MFYVRIIDPRRNKIVTLMKNYPLDNLIQAFIEECVRRTKGNTTDLVANAEKGEKPGNFFIFQGDKCIGDMVWALSELTNEPVLVLRREDRGDNLYFYSPEGELLKHDTHT